METTPYRQWYSVLLRYPEYLDSDMGYYYSFALAHDVDDAIQQVQADCLEDNTDEEGACVIDDRHDLAVVLVIAGACPDLKSHRAHAR